MSIPIRLFLIALLASTLLPVTAQQMNKCKQANGTYSYQDTPCAASAKQETLRFDARGNIKAAPKASEPPNPSSASATNTIPSVLPSPSSTPSPSVTPSPTPSARPMPASAPEPIPSPSPLPSVEQEPSQADNPGPLVAEPVLTPSQPEPKKSSTVLGIIALIIALISSIWLIVVAFQKSVLWGVLCFLFPFPVFGIFVAMNWNVAKKPFLIWIFSFGLFVYTAVSEYTSYRERSQISQTR